MWLCHHTVGDCPDLVKLVQFGLMCDGLWAASEKPAGPQRSVQHAPAHSLSNPCRSVRYTSRTPTASLHSTRWPVCRHLTRRNS